MKITKPLQHIETRDPKRPITCWFFEDIDFPDYDYDNDIVWQGSKGQNVLLNNDIFDKRKMALRNDNEDGEIFKELSRLIKTLVLEIKENHPIEGLTYAWPIDTWSESELNNVQHIACFDLKRDSVGFHMGEHLDNRNTKWTLIMNLKDNISSTTIHTDQGDLNIPNKKGSGVFYFNHENMYHSIGPVEDIDRLTLFWMKMVT